MTGSSRTSFRPEMQDRRLEMSTLPRPLGSPSATPSTFPGISHIGSLQAQRAVQTRWEHHSQVPQGQSISGLSNKRCVCSRRAPFLSVLGRHNQRRKFPRVYARQRHPVGHEPMARLLTRVKIPPAHVGAQDEPHDVCVIVQVTHRRLNAQLLIREIAVAPVDHSPTPTVV